MDTIILAGGYAKRMAPTTDEVPKHLLHVAGRPMLSYVLDSLEGLYSQTEGRCYLSVNRKFEQDFRDFIRDSNTNLPLELIVEDTASEGQKLGCLGALTQIQEQINAPSESGILVVGGDNIFSLDMLNFVNYQQQHPKRSLVALYDIGDLEKAKLYGVAKLDAEHPVHPLGRQIVGFEEKPTNPNSALVSTAIYVLKASDMARIEYYIAQGNSGDTIGSYIQWLIAGEEITGSKERTGHTSGIKSGVNGFVFDGYWFDIGSHESFEEANRFFAERKPVLALLNCRAG